MCIRRTHARRWPGLSRALWPLSCVAPAVAFPANVDDTPTYPELTIDQSVSALQGANERKIYVFDAKPGASYLVEVAQDDLDFIVTVERPDGFTTTVNSPLLRDDRELLLVESASDGRHELTIYSEEFTGAKGKHTISLAQLPDSAKTTEREAWRLMTAGGRANHAGGLERWEEAVAAYQAARDRWRSLGRTREEAQALYSAAFIEYWQLFNWTGSAAMAREATALYSAIDERALAANAQQLQAAALIERANEVEQAPGKGLAPEARSLFEQALALFAEAADVQEKLGRDYDVAQITNNIGLTYYYMGEFEQARTYWSRAAGRFAKVSEWSAETMALANQGVIDMETGRLLSAVEGQERILELLAPGQNDSQRAIALDNLGTTYRLLGRLDDALRVHAEALVIHRADGNPNGEALSLLGIGQSYYAFGDLELANQYLEQVLPLAEQTNDARLREAALRYLGNIEFLKGRYAGTPDQPGALEHHEAALRYATSPPDRAYLSVLIAADFRALGRNDEAATAARDAVNTATGAGSNMLLAMALAEAGRAQLAAGDDKAASEALQSAQDLFADLDMRTERADALHGLALVARSQGDLELATQRGQAALLEVESARTQVADPELRALYAARHRSYYESQIDLLMMSYQGNGKDALASLQAALTLSERSRARLTVDLVNEAAVDLERTIDDNLAARRKALYERLAETNVRQRRSQEKPGTQTSNSGVEDAAVTELAEIETQLKLLEAEIRTSNPAYGALGSAEVLDPESMRGLLDDDSALLQYALGEEASYAWLVTADSVTGTVLADRETIESAARAAFTGLQNYRPQATARRQLEADLARLAALVLEPIPNIDQSKRLIISADGALQYVPFGVLRADASAPRLVETTEIVNVPSLTVIDLQRQRAFAQPTKTLAIFADPVFAANDPRIENSATGTAPVEVNTQALRTRAPVPGVTRLSRLPSTGDEANSIAQLVPTEQRMLAVGLDANRDTVLDSDLSQYRFVHFATHGLIDSRYPALSALALSTIDASGQPEDGLLRLPDIFTLELNADLVALSACNTALGREIRGEGLLGLTQGFLYAGTRSLVVSLWQVPDRATAELMKRMYRYLLEEGLRAPDALRRAQLDLAADRRWRDPYFWGAMTVMGDWR